MPRQYIRLGKNCETIKILSKTQQSCLIFPFTFFLSFVTHVNVAFIIITSKEIIGITAIYLNMHRLFSNYTKVVAVEHNPSRRIFKNKSMMYMYMVQKFLVPMQVYMYTKMFFTLLYI